MNYYRHYHLKYAPNGDISWQSVDEADFKELLIIQIEKYLRRKTLRKKGITQNEFSEDEIQYRMDIIIKVLKAGNMNKICQKNEVQWEILFVTNNGADVSVDLVDARDAWDVVMRTLSKLR